MDLFTPELFKSQKMQMNFVTRFVPMAYHCKNNGPEYEISYLKIKDFRQTEEI